MSTIAQLVDRCETRFKDTTNRIITATEWQGYLADAFDEVSRVTPDWPWLHESTLNADVDFPAGSASVVLSAEITPAPFRITAVYNQTDDVPMAPLAETTGSYRDFYAGSSTGAPRHYRFTGDGVLTVFPTPEQATILRVEGYAPPARLDSLATSEEPPFPAHYHDLLVYGALARAYEDDAEYQAAQVHFQRFMDGVERMRVALLLPRTEGYPLINDTF